MVWIWIFGVALLGQAALGETATVAVAANFYPSSIKISKAFRNVYPQHRIKLVQGSSGKHVSQILQGAPFDVFLSADKMRIKALLDRGRIQAKHRQVYAVGRIGVWFPQHLTKQQPDSPLFWQAFDRVALANPRHAPYGIAAQEFLEKLGVWNALESKVSYSEHAGQTFHFVKSGAARVGIVSWALAQEKGIQGVWLVPESHHHPIYQEAALLTPHNIAAKEFYRFLAADEARQIVAQSGYIVPSVSQR